MENIDDLIRVCCRLDLRKPLMNKCVEAKRAWLIELLEKYGSVAKIAYVEDKPVAQILYYPEESVPYIIKPREGVIRIKCVYNPHPEYQKLGIARSLVHLLIDEAREKELFRGTGKPKCLIAAPFETGEFYSQIDFFKRVGFKHLGNDEYYFPLNHEPPRKLRKPPYVNIEKDRGKVIVFYEPFCVFSPIFAHRIREKILMKCHEKNVDLKIELINAWKNPEEFIKRGYNYLIINGNPVRSFYGTKEFEKEIERYIV